MKPPGPALLQLFVNERARVVGVIRRIVGCRNTAEDLAHETLLRLWERPVTVDDRSLVFRTAQNLALDHLRERRVRTDYARAQTLAADNLTSDELAPEAASGSIQEFDMLLETLRALPERTQRIFLLNRLDNLPYSTIAKDLGLSVSTVEKEMMRALDACRQALTDRSAP